MKIKFVPQDIEIEGDSSKSLLDLAKDAGIQIKSVCGGTPSCAECKIQIKEGEYNVLPPSDKEISLIGSAHFVDQSRLSCQLKCFGDVVIDMNEQIEKQSSGASTKRPQGKAQKAEGEESHAIEGSILLGGADLDIFGTTGEVGVDRTNERRAVQVFDEDETRRALEQIRRKREAASKRKSDDDDEYLKKLKRRDRKNQKYGDSDEEEGKEFSDKKSGSSKEGRKPNNRNNRNNKNRNNKNFKGKKQASGEGGSKPSKPKNKSGNKPGNKNKNRKPRPKKQD